MDGNGGSAVAQLAARVNELAAAHELLRRRIETTWRARLVDLERDVDVLLELLAAGGDVAGELQEYITEMRRVRTRAPEGENHGPDD